MSVGVRSSPPRPLLLLAGAAALAVLAVYLLVVTTSWGQRLDEYAFMGRDVISDLRALQAGRFLRVISGGSLVLATILVAAVAFLRGRPRLALIAAASILLALLCTELLKHVLLERPELIRTRIGDNSYPSGHTTIGMAVGIAAMVVVPARLRIATAVGAGAIGAAFGVAVVAAGWHRPSDAVGAYLVCLAVGAVAAVLTRAHPDRGSDVERHQSVPGPIAIGPTELGLVVLGVALAGVFGLAALTVSGIPWTSAGAGFLISSAAIVAVAFITTAALARAMTAADERALRDQRSRSS